jgi:hypothetical protein
MHIFDKFQILNTVDGTRLVSKAISVTPLTQPLWIYGASGVFKMFATAWRSSPKGNTPTVQLSAY